MLSQLLSASSSGYLHSLSTNCIANFLRIQSSYSFRIALTTALVKGAAYVELLILPALVTRRERLVVGRSMAGRRRKVLQKQETRLSKLSSSAGAAQTMVR